jgi:heme/copper-type cytochrome/quinol oxidase subunit 1
LTGTYLNKSILNTARAIMIISKIVWRHEAESNNKDKNSYLIFQVMSIVIAFNTVSKRLERNNDY